MSRAPADPEANNGLDPIRAAASEAALRSLREDLVEPDAGGPSAYEILPLLDLDSADPTWSALHQTLAGALGREDADGRGMAIFAEGRFVAGEPGVLAGTVAASRCVEVLDDAAEVRWFKSDGDEFSAGDSLGRVEGSLAALLTAERSALNFLCHLSGVATATRSLVAEARKHNPDVVVRDTRKTLPGLRMLEKQAVKAGGGENHRFGLYDGILLKDNHLEAVRATGLPPSQALRRFVDHALPKRPSSIVEIEADDETTADLAVAAGAEVVLCDNMSPERVARVVKTIGGRAKVEASGRITLDNVGRYAAAGVDYIAVGSVTHSARAIDISFEISKVWWD